MRGRPDIYMLFVYVYIQGPPVEGPTSQDPPGEGSSCTGQGPPCEGPPGYIYVICICLYTGAS